MKALARVLAVVSFAALVVWLIANESPAVSGGRPLEPGRAAAWRSDPLWDDGRAEVSTYELAPRADGRWIGGRAVLSVERDPSPGGGDGLRLSLVRELRLPNGDLHQRASVLVGRGDGLLRRMAVASAGAGSLATAYLSRGRLELRGDGAAEGERDLAYPTAALPEDGLSLLLRDWVAQAPPSSLDVFPSLLPGDFRRLESTSYGLSRSRSTVRVPAGSFAAVELRLESAASRLVFDFDERPPHTLLRLVDATGGEYRLSSSVRLPREMEGRSGDAPRLGSGFR